MAAGIPGIGIGGLFYLVNALRIPVTAWRRRRRGEPSPIASSRARRLTVMALAILVGTWLTGVVVGVMLQSTSTPANEAAGLASKLRDRIVQLQASALLLWVGTLSFVLLAVQVARFILRRRRSATTLLLCIALAAPHVTLGAQQARGLRAEIEPTVSGTHDTDGNRTQRAALAVRAGIAAGGTVGASALLGRATNSGEQASWRQLHATVHAHPRATLWVDAAVGVTQSSASLPTRTASVSTPTGAARFRWRRADRQASFDVRLTRAQLDVTPLLLTNQVVRTEAAVQAELPLAPWMRTRVLGKRAEIGSRGEPANARTILGASLLHPIPRFGEVAVNVQRIAMARATTQGYFAPREAQIVEGSTYFERENDAGMVWAVDAGVGAQRLHTFDAADFGRWTPAARLWTQLDLPLASHLVLRSEVDLYSGGVSRDAASAAEQWRWVSGSIALRLRR